MEFVFAIFIFFAGAAVATREFISVSRSEIVAGGNLTVTCSYRQITLDAEVLQPRALTLTRQTKDSSKFSHVAEYRKEDSLYKKQSIPHGRQWIILYSDVHPHPLTPNETYIQLTIPDVQCDDAGTYKCSGVYPKRSVSAVIVQTVNITVSNCSVSHSDDDESIATAKTHGRKNSGDEHGEDDLVRGLKIGLIMAAFVIVVLIVAIVALAYQLCRRKQSTPRWSLPSALPTSHVVSGGQGFSQPYAGSTYHVMPEDGTAQYRQQEQQQPFHQRPPFTVHSGYDNSDSITYT